MGIRRGSLSA
ncbi:hypothetical protein YPPY47_4128, partial [Yersinia pestis PY-47]